MGNKKKQKRTNHVDVVYPMPNSLLLLTPIKNKSDKMIGILCTVKICKNDGKIKRK